MLLPYVLAAKKVFGCICLSGRSAFLIGNGRLNSKTSVNCFIVFRQIKHYLLGALK